MRPDDGFYGLLAAGRTARYRTPCCVCAAPIRTFEPTSGLATCVDCRGLPWQARREIGADASDAEVVAGAREIKARPFVDPIAAVRAAHAARRAAAVMAGGAS